MGNRPFTLIAAILFAVMAVAHGYRLATNFQIVVGSHPIAGWVSIIALIVTIVLAIGLFREARR